MILCCLPPFLQQNHCIDGEHGGRSWGVNPADQRWGFWPLLPLSYQLRQQV